MYGNICFILARNEIMYQIYQGTKTDYPQVLSLIKDLAAFVGVPLGVKNTVEQLEKDENLFNCFVAKTSDGEVVGIATYFFAYFSWVGKSVYLDDLIVKKEWRGQGIGEALFGTILTLAKENQCQRVRWEVTQDNLLAQKFYKKKGAHFEDDIIVCQIEEGLF